MPTVGEIYYILSNDIDVDVEWEISDFYSLSKADGAGYWSPNFTFNDEEWYLGILPNGSRSVRDSHGHIDLALIRWSPGPPTRQEFSISLKTVNGEKDCEKNSTRVFEEWHVFHYFNRFLPRSELLRREAELLPSGVLTVVCTLKKLTPAENAIVESDRFDESDGSDEFDESEKAVSDENEKFPAANQSETSSSKETCTTEINETELEMEQSSTEGNEADSSEVAEDDIQIGAS